MKPEARVRTFFRIYYILTFTSGAAFWAVFFYALFVHRGQRIDPWFGIIVPYLGSLWSSTNDPVLNALIDLALIALVLVALWGIFVIGMYIVIVALAVSLISIVVVFLARLYSVSITGALVATAIALAIALWIGKKIIKKHGKRMADAFRWGASFLIAVMPRRRARKRAATWANNISLEEGGMTGRADGPNRDFRGRLTQLQAQMPDLPPVPRDAGDYGGWLSEVRKRVEIRLQNKTTVDLLERAKLVNQYYAEWLSNTELVSKLNLAPDQAEVRKLELQRDRKRVELEMAEIDAKMALLGANGPKDKEKQTIEERFRRGVILPRLKSLVEVDRIVEDLVKEFPDHEDFIRAEGERIKMLIREGRWD